MKVDLTATQQSTEDQAREPLRLYISFQHSRRTWIGEYARTTRATGRLLASSPRNQQQRLFADGRHGTMTLMDQTQGSDMERLWALLSELSAQLSHNRQQTEELHRRADELKVRADSRA